MKTFTPFRTRRLNAQLREMSIGDAIRLCNLPAAQQEAGTTEALKLIVIADPQPRTGQIVDVRAWTVLERAMVMAHYLANIDDDPNFSVGDLNFSDYIRQGADYAKDSVHVCDLAGDTWNMRPLLGADAEAIERLMLGDRIKLKGRNGWRVGAMAATLSRPSESVPSPLLVSDSEFDDWMEARLAIFMAFPDRIFISLLFNFLDTLPQLDHLLSLTFSDEGIVFLSTKLEGGPDLPPARFPFASLISEGAAAVFGKAQ